jgi:2-polyprenyl-3-methyl-5-hydroxy-6-metoxy-1,4-benzoquinol methylase
MTKFSTEYATKNKVYFETARKEILPILPLYSENVLEVGCGTGNTLIWLKEISRCGNTYGIELFESAAAIAKGRVDHVLVADIEHAKLDYPKNYFDLIMCLDVLEHLVDPWKTLSRLVEHLKPGGTVIASIPNVRHARNLLSLLFMGKWEYKEQGLLDKTHLRFFTKKSACQLMQTDGLEITGLIYNDLKTSLKVRILNYITLNMARDFLTMQYIIASRKPFND